MIPFGWLLIGAALGWLIHWLFDRIFWSSRRICTEDELRLRREVEVLGQEKGNLEGQIAGFDTERNEWNARFSAQDEEMADYRNRITTYQSQHDDLAARYSTLEGEQATLNGRIGDLEGENTRLRGQVGTYESDISDLNAKLAARPSMTTGAIAGGAAAAGIGAAAMATDDEPEPAAFDGEGDDLQKLWGIGPASEKVLNDNGVYTYAQLCKTDSATITTWLDESGGVFNLVREDTWPEQACLADAERMDELEAMQEEISAEYVTSTVTTEWTGEKDDLTKLWGIGPAVDKVLQSKGVYTFNQLAGMPLKMLQGIITAAGPRFTLVQPELWIPQAKVAATGNMDELEVLKKKISEANR